MALAKFIRDNAAQTLYYPAGGVDWEPLSQLSRYCDVFVYCDLLYPLRKHAGDASQGMFQRDVAWLTAQFKKIHKATSVGDRLVFQKVTGFEELSPACKNSADDSERWVMYATLKLFDRRGKTRLLELAYIKGCGVATYRSLFYKQSVAPRMICIRRPKGVDLRCRNSNFGQMVADGDSKPEFIVTHYPLHGCFDWGWNKVVKRKFDGWDAPSPKSFRARPEVAARREREGWGRVSLLARPKK